MKRNTALKILIPIMFVFFLNQAATVLLRDSISFKTFAFFHINGGRILLTLIVLHFILNLNWIRASYFPKRSG